MRNIVAHVEREEKLLVHLARHFWRWHDDVGVASLEFHTQRVVASLIYLRCSNQSGLVISVNPFLCLVLHLKNRDLTRFETRFEWVFIVLIVTEFDTAIKLTQRNEQL